MRRRVLRPGGRLFSVAVLSLGMLALPASDGVPTGGPPTVEVRTETLELSSGFTAAMAGSSNDWNEFIPVDAGDTVMVAVDWGGDDAVEVEVRTRSRRSWSPWFPVIFEPEHSPDPSELKPGQVPSTDSDPLWIGEVDQIQVRARGPVHGLDLVRIEQSGGAGLAWTPEALREGGAVAATEKPAILSRASWGADESIRDYTPREWNRANFAIVHHTAGRNDYAQEEVDDILRSVYAFHVLRKGWDDIAYNFLVDRFGTVWEGRAGGITRPVIGGHASGFNGGSIGVSAIGNFQATEPSPEMLQGLQDLLAWKLDLHHIDPHGESEEIAGGGSSNRFNRGDRVTLPNIIGHRHTNSTTCPGDKLYEHVLGLHGDVALADRVDAVGHPKAYGGPPQDREQPLHGIRPRWDLTFTRSVTWQLTILDEDGEVVRRGQGRSDGELSLAWDMRDSAGELVPPGRYLGQLDAATATGEPVTPVSTIFEVTPAAERHSGPSRIATAAALSSFAFEQNERVVIASAESFPDALVAGPLAGSLDAPILLVPAAGVPGEVVDEIRRLHASKAYIVGGEGRIPAKVVADLRASGITSVTRLAGSDRYATSAAVARFLVNRDHPREALLALGENTDPARAFPDALSAGAFGAVEIAPVLLVAPDVLPGAIDSVLGQRPWFDGLVVFGGSGAISTGVEEAAAEAAARYEGGDPVPVTRFAGRNRYETSTLATDALLARRAADLEEDGPSPYDEPVGLEVLLASGTNWPDALGASAAAARRGAVFVLVAPDSLDDSAPTRDWLRAHASELVHAVVTGGPGAVADAVVEAIGQIVASAGHAQEPPETWPGESATSFPFPLPSFPPQEPEPEDPEPTEEPTQEPTEEPTQEPTEEPTQEPTPEPTDEGTEDPVAVVALQRRGGWLP